MRENHLSQRNNVQVSPSSSMIVEQVYGPILKFHLSQDNGAQSLIKWTRVYPVLKVGWANKGWPPQSPDRCRWSERLNCRRWWTTAILAVSCCVEWRIPWLVCPCPLWTWWYSAVKWNANRNPMRPRDGKRFESDHSPWGFRNAACSRVQVKTSEIRESHSTHFSDNFIRKIKIGYHRRPQCTVLPVGRIWPHSSGTICGSTRSNRTTRGISCSGGNQPTQSTRSWARHR